MGFVFTVCAQASRKTCPIWPRQLISVLAFRDACRMLVQRIRILPSLPFASRDLTALANQVQAIGRLRPDAAEDVAS